MSAAQHILIFGLRLYRVVLSPAKTILFGPLARCRFSPSCSEYARQAVLVHGAVKGSGLALKRICRCHPWGGCGDDPVPPKRARPGVHTLVRHCGHTQELLETSSQGLTQ